MSNTIAFSRLPAKTEPDAKFTRYQVHEVVNSLTEARQVANDYTNAHLYTHRATVVVAGDPSLKVYDPIYLDGLPNGMSGYWTILSIKHTFNGQPIKYKQELEVGTDVLGDVNPNASANSQLMNITNSIVNQATTSIPATLVSTNANINGSKLTVSTPINSISPSPTNPITTAAVPAAATSIPTSVATNHFSLTTPSFSSIARPAQWSATAATSTAVTGPSALVKAASLTSSTSAPIISSVTAVDVGIGNAYNNGSATVTVQLVLDGNLPATYTVTPTPATSPTTFTSSSPTITVTGLASNTSYTFSVVASNSVGSSAAVVSNSITATTVPQSVTLGTPTASDEHTISIPVTNGGTGGSAITGYTVTSTPTVADIVVTTSTSPVIVTGPFVGGTAYTLTVAAVNANGASTTTTSSSVTPTAAAATTLALSTVTLKGDMIAATGPGAVLRVAVGTGYQTLIPDTLQTNGVRWGDDNNILTIMGAYL